MKNNMSIKVTGLEQVHRYIKNKENQIKKGLQKGVSKGGLILQNEIKASISGKRTEPTSVDTSLFKNTITLDESDLRNYSVTIYSPVPYSIYLEKGTSRIGARHHFENSKSRKQDEIVSEITKSIS
jgi:hypothetical protein